VELTRIEGWLLWSTVEVCEGCRLEDEGRNCAKMSRVWK